MPEMMNGWRTVAGLYDSPQDIDLYVGVLNEVHMQGAQVGPTAGCIIAGKVIIVIFTSKHANIKSSGLYIEYIKYNHVKLYRVMNHKNLKLERS